MDGNKEHKLNQLRQELVDIESRQQEIFRGIKQLEANSTDIFKNYVQRTKPISNTTEAINTCFWLHKDLLPRDLC